MKKSFAKIIFSILLILLISGCIVKIWMSDSQEAIDLQRYHMDVPKKYESYALEEEVTFKQKFIPSSKYFYGIEIFISGFPENRKGILCVELRNEKDVVIKEIEVPLAEIEFGKYVDILLGKTKLKPDAEEYQIWLTTKELQNGTVPNLLIVSDEDDLDQNTECYYDGELVGNYAGSMMGFIYGNDGQIISWYQMNAIKTVIFSLLGICVLYLLYNFRIPQKKEIIEFINNYRLYYQYLIICIFISLFCLSAIIGKKNTEITIPIWMWTVFGITGALSLITFNLYKKQFEKKYYLKIDKYEWILSIVCLLARVPMFDTIKRWDAAIYYTNLYHIAKNYDLSFGSIWTNFKLAGHPTYLYAFFLLIGEFLTIGKEIGVHIVNLCLTIVAMICIYRMFRYYWCEMPERLALISTIAVSLLPVYCGTFAQVNIDYPLFIFLIFLVYSEYKEHKVMMIFWTLVLLMTKETGWFVVAGYYCGYLIKLWMQEENKCLIDRIKKICNDTMIRIMVVGIILVGLFIIKQESVVAWGNSAGLIASKEAVEKYGCDVGGFYFYPEYIVHKLAQVFVLNFNWIFTIILCVGCISRVYKRKHNKELIPIAGCSGLLGAFSGALLFNMLYLTHANSRYIIVCAGVVAVVSLIVFSVEFVPKLKNRISLLALGITIILLVIQNFIYIDPISNSVFDRVNSGKRKVLSANLNIQRGESYINNYWYSSMDQLLDKMLAEVEYESEMQIINHHYKKEGSSIGGWAEYNLIWDSKNNERVFYSDEKVCEIEQFEVINTVMFEDVLEKGTENLSDEIVVYFMPMFNVDVNDTLEVFKQDYVIGEKHNVSNWGCELDYYLLTRKKTNL